jgi:acid phosphatase type 7
MQHLWLGIVLLIPLISGCGGSSSTASKTQSASLIAVGDIAQCNALSPSVVPAHQTALLVQSLITQGKASGQVLTLGDNVYSTGTAAEFQNCYEPTWGKFKSTTWATPGNHDYGVPNASDYYTYFGTSAGGDRKGFYAKSLNGWLVLSLNSNIDASAGSEQYKWLESQLSSSTERCVLAAWHHPVFTSAARGDNLQMREIFSLLVTKKADLVLQGHEHQFERFSPMLADGDQSAAGITSMVVGTGGASLSDYLPTLHAGSQARSKAFGVLLMNLAPGSADWQFIGLDQKSLDAGSLTCKVKG